MLSRKSKIKKVFLPMIFGILIGVFLMAGIALAQIDTGLQYGTATGLGTQDLRISIMTVVRAILGFLGVVAVVIILYGGWVWMTSAGNADRIAQAKRILINAVIGLVIIFSSFMIASFIINQLLEATGAGDGDGDGSCTEENAGEIRDCSYCDPPNWIYDPEYTLCEPTPECRVDNITPDAPPETLLPMNSVVRIRFNYAGLTNIDTDVVTGNIQVINDFTGEPVPLNPPTFSGNTVEITPTTSCLPPLSSEFCFEANTTFEIVVDGSSDIQCGGFDLICSSLTGSECNAGFTTGDFVDVEEPTVLIISSQVCQDPDTQLEALVDDDYGIAFVDFTDGEFFSASDIFISVPPAELARVTWNTEDYDVGEIVTILATATDYDSNVVSDSLDFEIRAGFCCNGVQDEGEIGVDCGGSCEACVPVIEWISPNDGAPGNLTTIHGRRFETAVGTVIFLGDPLDGGVDDEDGVDPASLNMFCTGTWTDEEIIIAVPDDAQDGPIQVTRADGEFDRTDQLPGGAIADFDVNTTVRPGLCRLNPSSGFVDDPVALDGINFSSPSEVYFGGEIAGGTFSVAASGLTISGATVPLIAAGEVGVRSKDLTTEEFSNPATFTVGVSGEPELFGCTTFSDRLTCDPDPSQCNPGFFCNSFCECEVDPDVDPEEIFCDGDPGTAVCDPNNTLCPEGYQCSETSCFCEFETGLPDASTYTWFFTTTALGPQVVETCNRQGSCNPDSVSSPTPLSREGNAAAGYQVGPARPDDGAVPIDSIVAAGFTTEMQVVTLNSLTISVYECGSADDPFVFSPSICTDVSSAWTLNVTPTSFDYLPSGLLTTNTWYQVTLDTDNIYGANGVNLVPNNISNNYSWTFKTRLSPELSQVGCVFVDPSVQLSTQINELKDWTADASAQDFSCAILNPISACTSWDWSTGEPAKAIIASSALNRAVTQSLAETVPDSVDVIAQCNVPTGFVSGKGELIIDFASPIIIDTFPNCGTACLNSKIGATFSLPMNDVSVTNAIELYVCYDDPACELEDADVVTTFTKPTTQDPTEAPNTYTGNADCFDINGDGNNDYCLVPNTFYRMVITDQAVSLDENKPLTSLNFDIDGDETNDAFSWIFRTQADFGLCLPDSIDVIPADRLEQFERQVLYSARPRSAPDACDPDFGQRLDPYSFDWVWDSTVPEIADLLTPLRDACGNGVVELGEDCDDGNLVSGDSCTGPSDPIGACLDPDDPDTGNTNYNVDVCGNGILERTELCERPGDAGCTGSCLLTGTVPGFSLCGDGQIDIGEECDDAELLLGVLPTDGGGCSSRCLIEDRGVGYCRSDTTNRFDFENGVCTGSCASGYSCIVLDSATGNTNTGPVCGNALIEAGEECDFGGTCSDNGEPCTNSHLTECAIPATATCTVIAQNGCSLECINSGSVYEFIDPPDVGAFQLAQTFTEIGETDIQSWLADFSPVSGPLGAGHLTVGGGDGSGVPVVIVRFPDCGTACSNVAIGAQFNMSMDPATINPANIFLYDCGADASCAIAGLSGLAIGVIADTIDVANPNDTARISLAPTYNLIDHDENPSTPEINALLPNTFYRVVIRNDVVSQVLSLPLSGLNFDDPNNSISGDDSHSWVFKTQPSPTLCSIGRVEVIPQAVTLGEEVLQLYYSQPWTQPDSCDPLFGQRLNPYFYNWSWDDVEVDGINAANFETPLRDGCGNLILEFGEDCDDGNLISGDGCSGLGAFISCQNEGSDIAYGSTCGNGSTETGEDYDDGNSVLDTANGDYLDSSCLWVGNTNYTGAGAGYNPTDVCGNGIIDDGEQCDNGTEPNGTDSDGCTDTCTVSGAVPGVGSICGDGQITLGEQCDDSDLAAGGTPSSGDGCTGPDDYLFNPCSGLSQPDCQNTTNTQWCFWTGAACITRSCLLETTTSLGNKNYNLPVCGNGTVENGEECDLGPDQIGDDTDGCSDSCLNNGSIAEDLRIDPYQLVRTLTLITPITSVNEEIRAWHNLQPDIVGVGLLTVRSGGDVPFALIGHQPGIGSTNQCLNIAVWAIFSQELDPSSLDLTTFKLCQDDCSTSPNLIEEFSHRPIQGECVNNSCHYPTAGVSDFGVCQNSTDCVGSRILVTSLNTLSGSLNPNRTYQVLAEPDDLLDINGNSLNPSCGDPDTPCNWSFSTGNNFCSCDYVGVRIDPTSGGNETNQDFFTCAGNSCGADTLLDPLDDDVEPALAGNQHFYQATCYDINNISGFRIPMSSLGIEFSWIDFDPDDIITLRDISVGDFYNNQYYVEPQPLNGTADVAITATEYSCAGSGQLCDPTAIVPICSDCQPSFAARQVVNVTNFICNNPWPEIGSFPYRDNNDNLVEPDTNFALYYCRDFDGDDLPALDLPGLILDSRSGVIKDLLFPISSNGDAIGIKVLPNPLHLSPEIWYRTGLCGGQTNFDNLCFSDSNCEAGVACQLNIDQQGSTQNIIVDGYQAIREGRTVYVAATNLTDIAGDPKLFSNIYLVSYNQGANLETIEIFNRILDQNQQQGVWTFNIPPDFTNHRICNGGGLYADTDISCSDIGRANTFSAPPPDLPCINSTNPTECAAQPAYLGCYWDNQLNDCIGRICEPIICTNDFECPSLSCNANKEKVVRDSERFGDLRNIQIVLANYLVNTGGYPTLGAGTYISSTTYSVWPSWQQTLADDLGQGLWVDPINRFVGCPGYYCDSSPTNGEFDEGEAVCNAPIDRDVCPLNDCLPVDPDQATTCWDEVNLEFSCPNDAFVYAYRSAENGLGYELYTNFEYEEAGNWRSRPTAEDPDFYTLPLSNSTSVCQLLDLEVSEATVSGGVTPSTCPIKRCYGPGNDPTVPISSCTECATGAGTFCSGDADSDGVCDLDLTDNCSPPIECPLNPADCWNPSQRDSGGLVGIGDACDPLCSGDSDSDGVCDEIDNCSTVVNPAQADADGDGFGDLCDPCTDIDGDGWWDVDTGANDENICPVDNCSPVATFLSSDHFGYCSDSKLTFCDRFAAVDTCPGLGLGVCTDYGSYNPFQEDFDNDQIGYICDSCLNFDEDDFGDYTFYDGIDFGDFDGLSLMQQEHFQGCQGNLSVFEDFLSSPSDLDNCPGLGVACFDPDTGVEIPCSNPGQEDIDGDFKGDICDIVPPPVCIDIDIDGYGDPGDAICSAGPDLDCNDSNPFIFPTNSNNFCDCDSAGDGVGEGTVEICGNSIDEDCDGVDEVCLICFDGDGDGYGDPGDAICSAGPELDCNDSNPVIFPNNPNNFCDCDSAGDGIAQGVSEICGDSIDNNCDGNVDEGCGTECTAGETINCDALPPGFPLYEGVCSSNLATCSGGFWDDSGCLAGSSSDTSCDGIDNDCDGSTDEEYVPTSSSCGVGECSATGSLICSGGGTVDTCTPGTPIPEICGNGLDEDCDGTPDDGCGTECVAGETIACGAGGLDRLGVCGVGSAGCINGFWDGAACDSAASAEVCTDILDNDCNGLTDCRDSSCIGSTGPGGSTCCSTPSECTSVSGDCLQTTCSAATSWECLYSPDEFSCVACQNCIASASEFNCEDAPDGQDTSGNICVLPEICENAICVTAVENCFDGVDNDADGFIDCQDSLDCTAGSVCGGNCLAIPTCNSATFQWECSGLPDSSCGNCGACNETSLNNFNCEANLAASCGGCGECTGGGTAFSCSANHDLCAFECGACTGGGTVFDCSSVINATDDFGSSGLLCNEVEAFGASDCEATGGPPCQCDSSAQCVGCDDADRDGLCDEVDECPYDPDNDFDSDNLCAVGCTAGSDRFGFKANGFVCDGALSTLAYDICQGGQLQDDPDGNGIPTDCEINSCLVLFGANDYLNIYVNDKMVAGNLYLPDSFKQAGEIIGNGSATYPGLTTKIFFNPSGWSLGSAGNNVVAFEALTNTWPNRQIRGVFADLTETGLCPHLNVDPKQTRVGATGLPALCYTRDDTDAGGDPGFPAANWRQASFDDSGWIASWSGDSPSPLSSLFLPQFGNPATVWGKEYFSIDPFTWSRTYCRSIRF